MTTRARLLSAALAVALPAAAPRPALAHAHRKGAPADAPRSFAEKPARGTWAKCSVSGDVFQVDGETQFSEYGGRTYAFCCPDCKPDFDKNPKKYADPK